MANNTNARLTKTGTTRTRDTSGPARTSDGQYIPSLYQKYYTSSDVTVYISNASTGKQLWLDKASAIAFSETLSSSPIYTVGDSRFSFLSRGNNIVSGMIMVNTLYKDYIQNAVVWLTKPEGFTPLSPEEVIKLNIDDLKEYKKKEKKYFEATDAKRLSTLDLADLPLFDIVVSYNNSDPIVKNKTFTRKILEVRIIGVEQGLDIGSDQNLVDGYKFLARELR